MKTTTKYFPEVRERAVRMVREHQNEHDLEWAAIGSIAAKPRLHRRDAAALGTPGGDGSR